MMEKRQGLLIIDHGSKKKAANHMLFDLVKLIRDLKKDLVVYGAHMELAKPDIFDGITWCIKQNITKLTIHPYMLSPGRHATQDIPRLSKTIMETHYPNIPYYITEPLGVDIELASLILKRAYLN